MIESANAKKYLLYALGEILLVMLGILLALQVNNWNEERKSDSFELNLLRELKKTIIADYNLMEMSLAGNRRTISSCEIILRHFDQNLPYHDSLSLHFATTIVWWSIFIRRNAFETAKEHGLDFIKDDSTRAILTSLYEQIQAFSQEIDEREALYYYNTVTPIIIELFESIDKLSFMQEGGNIPRDYSALRKNDTYRAILKTSIGSRRNINEWIEIVLELMKDLEKRLQKEIDTHSYNKMPGRG